MWTEEINYGPTLETVWCFETEVSFHVSVEEQSKISFQGRGPLMGVSGAAVCRCSWPRCAVHAPPQFAAYGAGAGAGVSCCPRKAVEARSPANHF